MKAKRPSSPDAKVLNLKVCLAYSDPVIWRSIEVLSTMTLGDLHYALQIAMGWTNSHMHEFRSAANKRYGRPDPSEEMYDNVAEDEEEVLLGDVLKRKGSKLAYTYDFGDSWEHLIVLEGIGTPEPGGAYPRCTAGEQNCPPDDCGGIYGYYDMLEILQDPDNEEYETYREWLGEDFDPAAFDLTSVNRELRRIKAWRKLAGR